jgi:poly(3-hydroxybutyrate) depolymerase
MENVPVMLPRIALSTCLLTTLAACSSRAETPPLPSLQIDAERVAVAGLSSGAYMAAQVHLAYSDRIHGAALIAGGPYGCAQADLNTALGPCMQAQPAAPDGDALAGRVRERAAAGALAPLQGLEGDRVLVLHGREDRKVAPAVGAAAVDLYRALQQDVPTLVVEARLDGTFGHLLPLAGEGDECVDPGAPYVGRCGLDAPGLVFEQLFGAAAHPAKEPAGQLRSFSQSALNGDGPDPLLADSGYLYVPPQCESASCGLLLAFHGCQQNADKVGEAFVREGGFNRWADAYGVVVLYPQTRATYAPLNPNACWDWWGYTGEHYDTREGAQLRWVARALDALGV